MKIMEEKLIIEVLKNYLERDPSQEDVQKCSKVKDGEIHKLFYGQSLIGYLKHESDKVMFSTSKSF
jgi:hypothetical protein